MKAHQSKLDQLISDYCPNGVIFKLLEEVAIIKHGKDYKNLTSGNIPVYGSGGIMTYVDTSSYNKPSVLIPRKGTITNLFYVETPFWNVDTIFYTVIDAKQIVPKFLYFYLETVDLAALDTGSGRPSLTIQILNRLKIPLPPLPIQQEIVKILDTFTNLEAELEAELEARRGQYNYYRDSLMKLGNFKSHVYRIGELARNLDSRRKPVTKSARKLGEYPYYGASGIVDYVNDYIFDGNYLLISEDGANLLARSTPIAFQTKGKVWVNNHAHILEFENKITQRFVEIYINSIDLSMYISGAAQPKLNQENLNKIEIPLPSIAEQTRIVSILDKFDALVNDISIGLPAELAARRRQYEYYRDTLLTFKERTTPLP